ncbi:MAG: hypothetical protein F3742_03055 [Nitrospinae bacterium]|nr:hypothetical protein [Nitrospinota bacterium]
MKTKLIKRVPNMVAILAFLALLAGNAFAIENSSRIVSPYWQSDSGSYTFIAVSHTSLSGMASQIGVTVNAIQNDSTAFGTAVTFTIQSGSTERIFVARTNHSSINPTSISSGKFIQGTTNFKHGHIRIDPIATTPTDVIGDRGSTTKRQNQGLTGAGFRDATMLSFWGAVVVEQNTTGFAMEFIGDMNDSAAAPVFNGANGSVTGPAAP